MKKIDLNNKNFALIENSQNGQVDKNTIFKYKQDGDFVSATYYGGTVKYGKIIAHLNNNVLDMLYQCITTNNELKAGKALADISFEESGKMKLSLKWEWITNENEKGTSEYIEV